MSNDNVVVDKPFYNFLERDQLPCLVLGVRVQNNHLLSFKDTSFKLIQHQAGGLMCHQHYIQGKMLTVREKYKTAIKVISKHYYGTSLSQGMVKLTDLLEYRYLLQSLMPFADCNYSYFDLEEAFYPIDLKNNTLFAVCKDDLPTVDKLDDLLDFEPNDPIRMLGSIGRWKLWILGENSD